MKVTIDGQTYRLRFEHVADNWVLTASKPVREELERRGVFLAHWTGNGRIRVGVPRRMTYCTVERLLSDDIEIVSLGYAVCRPTDNYVKSEGRYHSLVRCMDELPDKLKQYRDEFWRAYLDRNLPAPNAAVAA